jgi:uncharacterized Zn finger protein (UPF0148 family)
MDCPKCEEGKMQPLGYGDVMCDECGHTIYSETEEDFNKRLGIDDRKEPE